MRLAWGACRIHAEHSKSIPPPTQREAPPAVLPAPTFVAFIINMEPSLKDDVLDVFERSSFHAELGHNRIFWGVDDAVEKFTAAHWP